MSLIWFWLRGRIARTRFARLIRKSPAAMQIVEGFTVRPWLTDIGCGIVGIWWGLWVAIHQEQVTLSGGFLRFNSILPEIVVCCELLGLAQLWVAATKNVRGRQVIALGWMTLWSGIASGVSSASGQAAYTGYTFFNALILLRAY